MDTQKALQTLLKIAQNQQKMIEEQQKQIAKLAQLTHQQLSPQKLEPVAPEMHPGDLVLAHLPPQVRAAVRSILPHGTELHVIFQPNKGSMAALNAITNTVQQLVNQNKLPFAYTVRERG